MATTRNITRGSTPAAYLTAKPDKRTWGWVAKALNHVEVNLMDTVITEGDSIAAWLFTSRTGKVMKKSEKHLVRNRVKDDFIAFSSSYRTNAARYVAVFYTGEAAKPVTPEEFNTSIAGPLDAFVAIQPFAQPRGGAAMHANFLVDYSMYAGGSDMNPHCKVYKYCENVLGQNTGIQPVLSKDARVNEVLGGMVATVARHVEGARRVRVTKMVAEFCIDEEEVPWFLWTRETLTVNLPSAKKAEADEDEPESAREDTRPKSPPRGPPLNLAKRKGDKDRRSRGLNVDTSADPKSRATTAQISPVQAPMPPMMFDDGEDVDISGVPPPETIGVSTSGCAGDFCNVSLTPQLVKHEASAGGHVGFNASEMRRVMAQQQQAAAPTVSDSGAGGPTLMHSLTFKAIVQARAEAKLVQLMLRRHRQGLDGEFVSGDYYSEAHQIATDFPASVYRQVNVCDNCFKVYSKIEAERTKALTKRAQAKTTRARIAVATRAAGGQPHAEAPTLPLQEAEDGLARAQAALEALRPSLVTEMLSFHSPPLAVVLVVSSLVLLCTGRVLEWADIRRMVGNAEGLVTMMATCDVNNIPAKRLRQLLPILKRSVFQPQSVMMASPAAACLASWVLGVVQHAATLKRMNIEAGELDTGRPGSAPFDGSPAMRRSSGSVPVLPPLTDSVPRSSSAGGLGLGSTSDLSVASRKPPQSFAEKLEAKRRQAQQVPSTPMQSSGGAAAPVSEPDSPPLSKQSTKSLKQSKSRGGVGLAGTGAAPEPDATAIAAEKAATIARKRAQEFHMKRLFGSNTVSASGAAGLETEDEPGERDNETEARPRLFKCMDGACSVPYIVVGHPDGGVGTVNMIVLHDLFDTMESTQILLKDHVRHVRGQVLLLNFPGQAFTEYPKSEKKIADSVVLNNEFHATVLQQLLTHLASTGEFDVLHQAFHMVGFGVGGNIAACFGAMFGQSHISMFKSLTLFNAFVAVDDQLASILHSSVNVFACFPESRPDLPVSYWTRFIFSEAYVKRVTQDLALSMYTAVTNPITLDGRIRLTNGALRNLDLRRNIASVPVPLVVVQSTHDLLVDPANANALMEGRSTRQIWSNELEAAANWMGPRTLKHLRECLRKSDGALVMWVPTGHEIRQEAKTQVLAILRAVTNPTAAMEEHEAAEHAATVASAVPPTRLRPPAPFGQPEHTNPRRSPSPESVPRKYARRRQQLVEAAAPATASSPPPTAGYSDDAGDYSEPEVPRSPSPILPTDPVARKQKLEESEAQFQAALRQHQETRVPPLASVAAAPSPLVSAPSPLPVPVSKAVVPAATPTRAPLATPTPAAARAVEPAPRAVEPLPDVARPIPILSTVAATAPLPADTVTQDILNRRLAEEEEMAMRLRMLQEEQEARRKKWALEDEERLRLLRASMSANQAAARRETEEVQRKVAEEARTQLLQDTRSSVAAVSVPTVMEIPKPASFTDVSTMFQQMEQDDEMQSKAHRSRLADVEAARSQIEKAKADLMAKQMEARINEQRAVMEKNVVHIQRIVRGFLGRRRFMHYAAGNDERLLRDIAATRIQSVGRGRLARRRVKAKRELIQLEKTKGGAARNMQRVGRGFLGRRKVLHIREEKGVKQLQRLYRGHRGRKRAMKKRIERDRKKIMDGAAAKIQATWRMKLQMDRYRDLQIMQLAAIQLQRVWRGWLGRRRAKKKREWATAAPGPKRLALGLDLIESSKEAFERQRQELDALHRAQGRAEMRVSEIHAGLQENERELATIERELRAVDQLDAELRDLAHDKRLLDDQIAKDEADASAVAASGRPGSKASSRRRQSLSAAAQERQAEAYALEVAIHMKKAERERKKLELEAEFAGVFAEIEKKKMELKGLEGKIADMEATRQRKDREFQRLQRNLTELLAEQKAELDSLREKGVQLETATATSAAAAAATANAAREQEVRTQAIFQSTEELLKFQFMSMSLSYFSSLNMLSNLRDINRDTTAAAVKSSADTAAAAAAAAAAANIPTLKEMNLGASDLVDAATQRRKLAEAEQLKRLEAARAALAEPFPEDVTRWRVNDVCRWLETLTLVQYRRAFEEAAVDGEFLMELTAEDLRDVLGVEHELHVKKILHARNKLRPLSQQEQAERKELQVERRAAAARGQALVDATGAAHPTEAGVVWTMDTLGSAIRHNHIKRLQEALEGGFDIEREDENGNTLLLVACQNVSKKAVELLLARGAKINHQNKAGNTALHYAMAYDKEGALGELLIEKGANDAIENAAGMSPYDGLG